MTLAGIRPGDLVRCDVKGRVFLAAVEGVAGRQLHVRPESRNVTWRTVSARQVVAHWRLSKRSRSAVTA